MRIRHHDALRASLAQLPVDVLDLPPEAHALLHDIGARTVGDCLALPRDGLARRLGQELLDDLDRALGHASRSAPALHSARRASRPRCRCRRRSQEAEALLFAARRLLAELCGFLAATGKGVQRLRFTLAHEGREDTRFDLNLVAATRDVEHLTTVLRERLERLRLACPATAIALESELLLPLAARNLSFLPDAREQAETVAQLIERLRARLGDDAVQGLDRRRPPAGMRVARRASREREQPRARGCRCRARCGCSHAPRPLGEIARCRGYDGPLTLLAGPERIESGWWDGDDVTRDYFVARNPAQSLLWIYRERRENGGWYLHGFFA